MGILDASMLAALNAMQSSTQDVPAEYSVNIEMGACDCWNGSCSGGCSGLD
jgi:hypothetical protein